MNNTFYPTAYGQAFNNPYMAQQQPPLPRTEIVKVNGKNGADAYQMSPNSTILLLDETAPIVWLKSTDGAGYATLTPYSITPYKEAEPVDLTAVVSALNERVNSLEAIINEQSDTKQNKSRTNSATSKSSKTNDGGLE